MDTSAIVFIGTLCYFSHRLKVSQSASLSVILFHCRFSVSLWIEQNAFLLNEWKMGLSFSFSFPSILFVCNLCYGESCKKTYRAEKKARVNWSKWPKLLLKLQLENWRKRRDIASLAATVISLSLAIATSLSLFLSLYCSWVISDDHFFVSIDFVLYDLSSMSCL